MNIATTAPLVRVVIADADAQARARFFRMTYAHLALAIAAFVAVEAFFLDTPVIVSLALGMAEGWWWLLALLAFGYATSFAEALAREKSGSPEQYLALAIAVIAQGVIFVPLVYFAVTITGDASLLKTAGVLTAVLFTSISAAAFVSGKDFSMLRPVLIVAGMLGLSVIVLGIVFGFTLGLWFAAAMVCLAAASILYQTSQMMFRYQDGQHVAAALGLFGAFMLMLWYILSILNRASSD